MAQAFTGAPEPTTAQKAAGGIDLLVKKAEDAAGSVADLMKGAPEPTTAQKVAGGIDSALAKAEEAIASVIHSIAGDKSASQPAA